MVSNLTIFYQYKQKSFKPTVETEELTSHTDHRQDPASSFTIKTDTFESETNAVPEFRCFHCDEMIASHLMKDHWNQCLSGNAISGFI